MKRKFSKILGVGLVLLLLISVLLMAAPVAADGGNARGAVKADLTEYFASPEPGDVVGSVILNTTEEGVLIVVIKMDAVSDLEDYDVRVHVNLGSAGYIGPIITNVLSTNAQGNGNAIVKIDVSDFSGPTVRVRVVLRQSFVPEKTTPCYTTEWPIDAIVPLK